MEFLLASTNTHKAEELADLLGGAGVTVKSAESKLEVVEDGNSFQENALIKAKAYYDQFGKATVADDSGLVVPHFPDILGIYSARFSPELPDYKDKNNKLIEMMEGLSESDRSAYFVCYLCFYKSSEEIYFFEGRVHGTIATEQKGSDGFGYDPIFLPDGQGGKALAEVGEWKMKNSHRAKACKEAVTFFGK